MAAIDYESHLGSDGGSANVPASRESATRLADATSPPFTVDLSKPLVFQADADNKVASSKVNCIRLFWYWTTCNPLNTLPLEHYVDGAISVQANRMINVMEVGHLGENYHQWVHHAIVTKQIPYFFENKFLEFNTRTVWWIIPLIWVPVVWWTQIVAIERGLAFSKVPTGLLSGVLLWSLIEYLLHRFLFHIKTTGYWSNTAHYLLHGCHHKFPLDSYRLVFPPAATSIFCVLFWNILRLALPADLASSVFGGGLFGYVMYDLIHYFLHHGSPFNDLSQRLKRYHLNHHFKEPKNSFGITSSLWDWVFDTLPCMKFT